MLNGGIEKKFPSFKISSKPSTFARLLLNGGTQNYGNLEQVLFIYLFLVTLFRVGFYYPQLTLW